MKFIKTVVLLGSAVMATAKDASEFTQDEIETIARELQEDTFESVFLRDPEVCEPKPKCVEAGGFCARSADVCNRRGMAFVQRGCYGRRCGCCIKRPSAEGIPTVVHALGMALEKSGLAEMDTAYANEYSMEGMLAETSKLELKVHGLSATGGEVDIELVSMSLHGYSSSGLPGTFISQPGQTVKCKLGSSCEVAGHIWDGSMPNVIQKEDADTNTEELVFAPEMPGATLKLVLRDWTPETEPVADMPKPGVGQISADVIVEARDPKVQLDVPSPQIFQVEYTVQPLDPSLVEIGQWVPNPFHFERKQQLCLQPVFVAQRRCLLYMFGRCWYYTTTSTSGAGLAFGKPRTDSEWKKVDVIFHWRAPVTVNDYTGKYQSLLESEMTDLHAEYSANDCVEIFFVEEFSPSSTYGGGACWGSGTAGAKIISSDEQVACGVDRTHLAHEVGHALGLMHPGGATAALSAGSRGTLMCPSGWQRDNPSRNSRDNGNNVVNPLVINTWAWSSWFPFPDCSGDPSCGECVLVDEPCV